MTTAPNAAHKTAAESAARASLRAAGVLALALAAPALALPGAAAAQSMEVRKGAERQGMIGSSEVFTGTVYVEMMFGAEDPMRSSAGRVVFTPGARSAWHTHPQGQMLIVTDGTGWVQERGQPKQVMTAGDVVWCPPGVEHWHGATDKSSVTHCAIQQQDENGQNVAWGAHVTDAEYHEGHAHD
ncbi:(R)-mandelonitrile lyase [Rhodovulum sp. DZ06]|uniref:(R)-mandelonitrile lyase n=1 Tax=Rhodovulum sp. DZ06 TaxID=3425126 RepID=UPI003D348460